MDKRLIVVNVAPGTWVIWDTHLSQIAYSAVFTSRDAAEWRRDCLMTSLSHTGSFVTGLQMAPQEQAYGN